MIRVIGHASCGATQVQADPWIPLTVNWQFEERSGLLNLYVRGANGGYVEMRVDECTGALLELVVIEAPPERVQHCSPSNISTISGTVVLDREMWQWRVTPDYVEPTTRDVSMLQDLSWSVQEDKILLLFSKARPTWLAGSNEAEFGISEAGELVCMAVSRPNIELPPGYPT